MNKVVSRKIATTWIVLIALLVGGACQSPAPPAAHEGAALAQQHCSSCHAFPEPGLLDDASWQAVLPYMGGRLGVYATHPRDSLIASIPSEGIDVSRFYPETPALTEEEWHSIVDYYLDEAPAELEAEPRTTPLTVGLPGFEVHEPEYRFRMPLTTVVDIQPEHRLFLLGNYAQSSTLLVINSRHEVLFDWKPGGAPVATQWHDGQQFILLAGPHLAPTDVAEGSVQVITGPQAPLRPVITGLTRPVDMDLSDLNGDGRTDFVICEFGNYHGFLSWYEDTGDGTYRRHVLHAQPGAANALIRDVDGDGRRDIVALMAQGDEGVDIYFNEGDGQFRKKRVLRFPPVYGSNHIELADFNEDGILDLLYANGDNADITPILKPYHGVRIFLGSEEGTFEERYFFPLHGAISAKPADVDGDGDLDIAAISYFPDYANTPEESFVLLRNEGDFRFAPYTFEESYRGRWLRMDVGDLDGDQDPDILLGSNIGFRPQGDHSGLFERWVQKSPSVVILENESTQP